MCIKSLIIRTPNPNKNMKKGEKGLCACMVLRELGYRLKKVYTFGYISATDLKNEMT